MSASLAAAGYNRTPIDDEEDIGPGPGMRQRFSSFSSHPTISTPITDDERAAEAAAPSATLYDPYADYGRLVGGSAGYAPTRSDSPAHNSYSSGMSRPAGAGRVPRNSTGSSDPLLAGMAAVPLGTPGPSVPPTPTLPPRSPRRLAAAAQLQQSQESAAASSTRGSEERSSSPDDRLDPALATLQVDNTRSQELRDDVDYSRPVLEVRNHTDNPDSKK